MGDKISWRKIKITAAAKTSTANSHDQLHSKQL
jgi:hypothetical protein